MKDFGEPVDNFGIKETRTPEQALRAAMAKLRAFRDTDIDGITSLSKLSAETLPVRRAFHEIIELEGEDSHVSEKTITGEFTDGSNILIKEGIDRGTIHIERYLGDKKERVYMYLLEFPTSEPFTTIEDPISQVFALNTHNITTDSFRPALNPNSEQDQQGFARILQQATRDMLPVIFKWNLAHNIEA